MLNKKTPMKNPTIKYFGIYDKKAERLFHTFKSPEVVSATRQFEQSVNDTRLTINQYPQDFKLMFILEIDEKTCKSTTKNIDIAEAQELIKATESTENVIANETK